MNLRTNQEIVGVLRYIKRENEKIILTFEMCRDIEVPFFSDFDKNIYPLVGRKIGLLFLENGAIKVREI